MREQIRRWRYAGGSGLEALAFGILFLSIPGAGQARGDGYETRARLEQGVLLVVPDAEGGEESKRNLVTGLADSGIPYGIRIHAWAHPIPKIGPILNQPDSAGNRRAAHRLAEEIAEYQKTYPSGRVFLIGDGAGGGMVIFGLEALADLPDAAPVAGAFLLSAGISADYDLGRALSMTELGVVNVYHSQETLRSPVGERVTPNVDGSSGASAGRIGFTRQYPRLFDHEFVSKRAGDPGESHPDLTHAAVIAARAPRWVLSLTWPPEGEADDHGQGELAPESSMPSADGMVSMIRSDPQAFLKLCLEKGAAQFTQYRCVFIKNERMGRKLTGDQVLDVLYRHKPRSVYMKWMRNPAGAKRVLWVHGRDRDSAGREQVRVEPTGMAALFVNDILLRIDDKRVRQESRRPITDFGFYATLEYIVRDNDKAAQAGVLDLRYDGTGVVDGRPTYVLIRQLPYDRRKGAYPDARMVLHIDQEWLVPLSIYCYADNDERTLLESYEITRVKREPALTDQDFQF